MSSYNLTDERLRHIMCVPDSVYKTEIYSIAEELIHWRKEPLVRALINGVRLQNLYRHYREFFNPEYSHEGIDDASGEEIVNIATEVLGHRIHAQLNDILSYGAEVRLDGLNWVEAPRGWRFTAALVGRNTNGLDTVEKKEETPQPKLHPEIEKKIRYQYDRVIEELSASIVLVGGARLSNEKLESMTLQQLLSLTLPNHINWHIRPTNYGETQDSVPI